MHNGEGAEEKGVDYAEGGGAGANGEGERKNSGGGGDFSLQQLAPAEDEVGTQIVEPAGDAGVPALFAQAQRRTERPAYFDGVIPRGDGFFHMRGKFLIDFAIETIPTKCIADARPERHS